MYFYLIGTDYKNADVSVRESLLSRRKAIEKFLRAENHKVAILSTCNRFEIYSERDLSFANFLEKGYYLNGKINIFRHSLRLACGLESQLRGEKQILEQLCSWLGQKHFPDRLASFWDRVLFETRKIRDFAGLNQDEYNIATAILADLRRNFPNAAKLGGIVVGTGKIAELFARYCPDDISLSFVSHKNRLRAKEFAEYAKGRALIVEDLSEKLLQADFLISATASPHFIFKKAYFEQLISGRKTPLYVYDLAIPRDIEPTVINLEGVVLTNLDDLTPALEYFSAKIKDKLNLAEYLVEEAVKSYEREVKEIEIRDTAESTCFTAS